jgi:hypothetical protein
MNDIQQLYLWLLSEYLSNSQLIVTYQFVIVRYINLDNDISHVEVLIKVN